MRSAVLPKSSMYRHQQAATTRLYESNAVQAVVPMGGGKTCATLTAIRELIDDGHIRCAIVLAPKRVAQLVWPAEIRKWEHLQHTRMLIVDGTAAQRAAKLKEDADVYVIGIDNTKWLVDEIKELPDDHKFFGLLCIDEISRFKSPRSKRVNKSLAKIVGRFKIRWGLTGTPRPNSYIDQFRPLQLLTDATLFKPRSFDSWKRKHFISDYAGFDWEIRPEHEHKIVKQIASMSFTVDPADMPDVPELVNVIHWVDLPKKALDLHREMKRKLFITVRERGFAAASAGVASGKLEQIAQGFIYGEGGNKDVEHLHSAKYDELVEIIEGLEEPALIPYAFVEDLRLLQGAYPGLPFLGAGVSDKLAAQHEADWNAGKLQRLALHPASAGHGLNLQYGGNQMIWYGMTWSPELYDQTIKRFHRPGQARRCFNHLILARDTVDEAKYDRVVQKMSMQEAFMKWLEKV